MRNCCIQDQPENCLNICIRTFIVRITDFQFIPQAFGIFQAHQPRMFTESNKLIVKFSLAPFGKINGKCCCDLKRCYVCSANSFHHRSRSVTYHKRVFVVLYIVRQSFPQCFQRIVLFLQIHPPHIARTFSVVLCHNISRKQHVRMNLCLPACQLT